MTEFKWTILEIFADAKGVKYHVQATNEKNIVEGEGNHQFSDGVVSKPFSEIKEEDLIRWLDSDTTKDGLNLIKSNLETQLQALENREKVEFPWLANTFTIE
jgi:hypothetical protein